MVDAQENLNGSRDLTTPISGMICHPCSSTCYDQPIYQNWSLYLHPVWRCDRQYKLSKIGCFGV